jgi:hypothetical protein
MTIDELERDLATLAEPQEADERLRLAIRAQLGERWQVRPRRRFSTRLVLAGAAVSAAAVAVAIVTLIGTSGSGGPASADAAIIHHAIGAITSPANVIVHVKETGLQDGTPVAVEWWQQTSPPFAIRMIKGPVDRQSEGADQATKSPVGHQSEAADDGTTSSWYDPSTNTIYQRPDSSSPTLIDPLSTVREQLASGSSRVTGAVTVDGLSLYKIELPNGVVGYFDRTDYHPVYVDNPQRDGSVVRTRVLTYEELPMTPENEQLLSITAQHPRASVDTNPTKAPSK